MDFTIFFAPPAPADASLANSQYFAAPPPQSLFVDVGEPAFLPAGGASGERAEVAAVDDENFESVGASPTAAASAAA